MFSLYFNIKMSSLRFNDLTSQLGWGNGLLYLLHRLGSHFFKAFKIFKYYFVAQQLNKEALLPSGRGKSLKVVELKSDDFSINSNLRPFEVIQDRYAQKAVCLAVFNGEEFAGYLWYVKSVYSEDEVRCKYVLIPTDAVWDFDVFVIPKFRLSPVFLKLWDASSEKLISEGFSWSFSRVSAFNSASLASHKRMGAEVFGWAVFIVSGKFQMTISSLPPFLHVTMDVTSYPIFKLNFPKPKI